MRYVIELNFTNASFLSADDGNSSSIEEDTIEPLVIAQVSSEGEDAVWHVVETGLWDSLLLRRFSFFFIRMLFFRPRLNILSFLPILG